ncbi:rho GTPase-activating protein 21-like isoform X1 [Poecilia formosa]|uniref:rho GTPase-activating protein 21-like isoform X1 n=2 Tax=Poecilia formosa TaxID=48698 RepID=UPI0004440EC0|nr:PREDICTED: rho GTPase-activating protein 21-like isoform X1 [Poecilia formosa]
MMASRWAPTEEDERHQARSSFCEKDSAERQSLADCPAVQYSTEEEPFAWPRPKTVRLRRTSLGFGFTLRHFIVYPPESSLHCFPEEDCGRRGRQRNRLEPMDTIFVKQVKEGGPAHEAGLCTGDRIVKVNGASIIGKAYSEVITLIQDSGDVLELCVMPKDEDVLQLAYSQDAYLRGYNSYSGNASHIPDPPVVCYPRVDCKPTGMAQATDPSGQVCRGPAASLDYGYRKEITVPPSPPRQYSKSQTAVCMRNDSVRTVVVPPNSAHMGRVVSAQRVDFMDPAYVRGRPGSLAQYPFPRKADIYPSGPGMVPFASQAPNYPSNHQNIDWRTYQTYREYIDNKGIHSHGSRTIQERLDNFRIAGQPSFAAASHIPRGDWVPKGIRRRSTSHERSYHGPPPHFQAAPRSASQDRMRNSEKISNPRNWPPRSVSQDALVLKARSHSIDYVEPIELSRPSERRAGYPRADQGTRPSRQAMPRNAVPFRPSAGYSSSMRGAPNPHFFSKGPDSLQTRSSPMLSDMLFGKSTEHSFTNQRVSVPAHHLGHTSQPGQNRMRSETIQISEAGRDATVVGIRSSSSSAAREIPQRPGILKTAHQDSQSQVNGQSPSEPAVVMREKPHSGKNPSPLRHPSYILAVNDEGADSTADVAACWLPNDTRREIHMRRLEEQRHNSCSSNLDESLDAIPFIDEPVSPSVDREAAPIPPSAVISVAPSIATAPSSQGSPCPTIHRQLSHDQESMRSALLDSDSAGKTERSKSYDEGLDNYQEERRGSTSKHMASFRGLRKTLDGHKPAGDSGSRRESSLDVFADSSKEGLLNFRQLSTDKNKRVGGGMRSWKQMYAILQGHTLTLYKDKKDALSHAASQSDEDPLRISIKACLIDISYSETRRKNVLRLTTSDCEYLFQAEGREDMLSWIRVIQENSNPDEENGSVTSQDLISRKIKEYNMMSAPSSRSEPSPKSSRQSLSIKQAFLGGKTEGRSHSSHSPRTGEDRRALKDESSPPRDRGAWKIGIAGIMKKPFEKKQAGITFGVRLEDCPPAQTNRFVPLLVEVCCQVVEERGLEYTGIYRVPGNNAAISNMQEELNTKGMADIDIQEDKWRDINVIGSLLKAFFRKLPEPLFTNEKYDKFIEASRTEDSVERLKELKRLVYELPTHHLETLKFLCAHLKKVSDNCEQNKMEPRNLAIVFGPTLVRTSEDNMTDMVNHMPDQCKIVENLVQQFDWFFMEDGSEDPVAVVEQESTVQSQPVPNIGHLLTNISRVPASSSEVSDTACPDSNKSKGLWISGNQCSKEMLRSSIFANRKRKKNKEKSQLSSSDDDLDSGFNKKELPEGGQQPLWSQVSQAEDSGQTDEDGEKDKHRNSSEETIRKDSESVASLPGEHIPSGHQMPPYASPSSSPNLNYRMAVTHQSSLSDPPSNYDDTVSDLGTMNSTSSQASVPRARRNKSAVLGADACPGGLGAEVCSITSDYSTTSSMTFLTGAETCTLSPEVQSVSESRGGEDADDERSELISEGRPVETDSESDLSVFTIGKAEKSELPESTRPLPSHRLIECDTLSRKKSSKQKTESETSLDDKDPSRLSQAVGSAKGRSSGSLSSSSRSEQDKTEPAWKLKITDRLKVRLRMSVDDMFGVGSQRSRSPEGRSKKKNIRRRHTMGGQRDFAELSVLGDWSQPVGSRSELSAVDRLKPKCSSQDFSIGDWIARERHRTSNPEVSLDLSEQLGALCGSNSQNSGAPSSSELARGPAEALNGEISQSKNLSLSATAHPHKLTSSQVVHSRFYQYL